MDDDDDLLQEYRNAEVSVLAEPLDQEWGTREFAIRDPDGSKLIFAQGTG